MAEAQSPKRPQWFWPVVAIIVLLLAAGGFAAPSVIECSGSGDGFANCISSKLAQAGLGTSPTTAPTPAPTEVSVAQPADTAELPPPTVSPPDFGVRVEPNGSLVIVGSGMAGKQVQIFVNGELYGTAKVEKGGDWVLVPEAPLPPGGYELTVVDPDTGKPLDKSFVVSINADKASEPLVVASTPGKASEILQGLTPPTAIATAEPVAQPETPPPASEATEPASAVAVASADEPAEPAVTPAEPAVTPAEPAVSPAEPAVSPAEPAVTPAEPVAPAEAAKPEEPQQVATATPEEDVVGDVDALQKRVDALKAAAAPTIDAIEIDSGKNFFAGTGADGAVIRVYVDNVVAGDAPVKDGHWLLETSDVLKNKSQRVRADQLLSGTAEVASRAEVDFVFEEPAAAPAPTAVAEAPITVPLPDYGIDTDQPAIVPVTPPIAVAEASPAAPAPTPEPEPVAAAPTEPQPAAPAETPTPTAAASAAATGEGAAPASPAEAGATATGSGVAVAVPEPDFSVDTGIPVVVVPEATVLAEAAPPAESAPAAAKPETTVVTTAEPVPVVAPTATEPDVPTLVAKPVGPVDLGRFATGKAIIRSGDNLWTIARRAYGTGVKYTQIYGANREQIRNPNLIYPGQVFDMPGATERVATD